MSKNNIKKFPGWLWAQLQNLTRRLWESDIHRIENNLANDRLALNSFELLLK